MATRLPIPKGINAIPVQAIPDHWDKQWFSTFIRTWMANGDTRNAIAGTGIQITGQSSEPATVSVATEIQELFAQDYLVAAATPILTSSRVVQGEASVVSVTQTATTFTIGLVLNAITAALFRQSVPVSVVGNPTGGAANVVDIAASADGQVLQRQAGALVFANPLDQVYSLPTPLTGATIVTPNGVSSLLLNPGTSLAALTVNTPLTPADGQLLRISTSQNITTLTFLASAGQTLTAPYSAALAVGPGISYQYVGSISTWFRLT